MSQRQSRVGPALERKSTGKAVGFDARLWSESGQGGTLRRHRGGDRGGDSWRGAGRSCTIESARVSSSRWTLRGKTMYRWRGVKLTGTWKRLPCLNSGEAGKVDLLSQQQEA
ncbi:hypothetical protein NEUTE1DRAFT_44566 [Neurospora tetrasperma FGSC 2508]|uniref:Uncharacterized protein n=1 Tax=Neurospora tetrasperma (strain FGSC 2508 / ATCC MYA-4615 / P0657) TaxID=510951 RepID=F8MR97_NEUT8|nr:uncharacterized protein NEUTE1DRAFT_44566 [Neurospora tetrasperma FGSC 2508]EGO56851.1 hypothetical protein NEUTE1DRAFT_44566 [Neurospora tetrasperma FGSC 2508]EGZ70259.1 hypothetical protein NEUTE2DRAFT_67104 [Neurospora tetrasperma FGSC 2509]